MISSRSLALILTDDWSLFAEIIIIWRRYESKRRKRNLRKKIFFLHIMIQLLERTMATQRRKNRSTLSHHSLQIQWSLIPILKNSVNSFERAFSYCYRFTRAYSHTRAPSSICHLFITSLIHLMEALRVQNDLTLCRTRWL